MTVETAETSILRGSTVLSNLPAKAIIILLYYRKTNAQFATTRSY